MEHGLKLIGIAGSIRGNSYARAVMHSTAQLFPPGTHYEELLPGDLPHYNNDHDNDELPAAVKDARRQVAGSHAVLIVTPEFNHGLPGVLKNALDWLSRPAFKSCFVNKPVMFATISPGALGGVRAQYQLRETLSSMLCRLVPLPEIAITQVGTKVSEGRISDEAALTFIGGIVQSFLSQNGLEPGART